MPTVAGHSPRKTSRVDSRPTLRYRSQPTVAGHSPGKTSRVDRPTLRYRSLSTMAGHSPGKTSCVDSRPTLRYHSQFECTVDVAGAPTDKKWYHGGITEDEAINRLRMAHENGTYLVYDNPSRRGEYILLVYSDSELHRWRIIRRKDGMYVLGDDVPGARTHDSVAKLIKYHRGLTGKPIMFAEGGRVTLGDYAYMP